MKVVILAGGMGTRLSEETEIRPKPMVEIGGKPILWHIMKYYSSYGFNEFVIALGYKGDIIKDYFASYKIRNCAEMTVGLRDGVVDVVGVGGIEDWTVHLVDTGLNTNTGVRLHKLSGMLSERFMLTYGDGVSDVDLLALIEHHNSNSSQCDVTVTAVHPPSRFGGISISGTVSRKRVSFAEKDSGVDSWINGGFMVMESRVLRLVGPNCNNLEDSVLSRLASVGGLAAYEHNGFWQCMDTLRDKRALEELWRVGRAPWKVW